MRSMGTQMRIEITSDQPDASPGLVHIGSEHDEQPLTPLRPNRPIPPVSAPR